MIYIHDSTRTDQDSNLNEQIARTERGPIGHYRFGYGSPVILITGHLSTLSEWNAYFLGKLAKGYEIIVFDNRGIGRSTTSVASYSVDDLALDTVALIESLGFDSVSILGWSMGGIVARKLVLDQPSMVSHLILLNTAPPGHSSLSASKEVEEALTGHGSEHFDEVMKVMFPPSTVQRVESDFSDDMFRPHDYLPARISADVTNAQEILMQNWAIDDDSFAALHQVSIPTLVLGGEDDEVLGFRNSVILSHIIPKAKLVKIQSGGHAMMYQYPQKLAHLIDTFISAKG